MKLTIDRGAFEVKLNGKSIHLAPKEFDILDVLIKAKGNVVTRESILTKVWPVQSSDDLDLRTVDQHVCRLRKKIGTQFVRTVPTRGFRFIGSAK